MLPKRIGRRSNVGAQLHCFRQHSICGPARKKVTLDDVASQWPTYDGTVEIAHKDGDPKKLRFIYGSGHQPNTTGTLIRAHHDQTGASLGDHRVVNFVHIAGGKIVHKDSDLHLNDAAPILVYK